VPASGLSTVKGIGFAVEELRVDLFDSGDGAFRTFGAFWSRAQLARSGVGRVDLALEQPFGLELAHYLRGHEVILMSVPTCPRWRDVF
jgi:hypothetical protein